MVQLSESGEVKRCLEVEDLIRKLYDALRCADVDLLLGLLTYDADLLFVGTDPAEWWEGRSAVEHGLQQALREASGYGLAGGRPRAFRNGPIAWVSDSLRFLLPDGAEIPLRLTAVARRGESTWRLVQVHMSVGLRSDLPPEVVATTARPRPHDRL